MVEEIMTEKMDIIARDYDVTELAAPSAGGYCSIKAEDFESKAIVYNAANNPQHKVSDHINQLILVKDVYAEVLELVNEETGELQKAPRVVLIDNDGEAYEAVSAGIFSALKKMMAIFGEPTWEGGIPVRVKQQKVKRGSMLTLDIVKD